MKKSFILVTTGVVAGLMFSSHSGFASNQSALTPENTEHLSEQDSQTVHTSNYMNFSGTISELKQENGSITLTIENQETSMKTILHLSEEALILNSGTTEKLQKEELKEGLHISAYYDKYKPMLLIYPPVVTPDIIVVNDKEMGNVKVSMFDKNFLSLDNTLKLHLSEETILLNEQGDRITKEELKDKELIVFYTVTTKSIPAQTTPVKIIALEPTEGQLMEEVQQLISEDHYIKNETKMIPIRKVAEHLGYHVEWKQGEVIINKQNRSFQISIKKKEYGYNRSIRYFKVAPEIKNGKTYVSEEFLGMLVMNK